MHTGAPIRNGSCHCPGTYIHREHGMCDATEGMDSRLALWNRRKAVLKGTRTGTSDSSVSLSPVRSFVTTQARVESRPGSSHRIATAKSSADATITVPARSGALATSRTPTRSKAARAAGAVMPWNALPSTGG